MGCEVILIGWGNPEADWQVEQWKLGRGGEHLGGSGRYGLKDVEGSQHLQIAAGCRRRATKVYIFRNGTSS